MDTLKEYTKMCHKAREIQALWGKDIGDICSVIWKEGSSTGGLEGCILQDEPVYGLEYSEGRWQYYNGKMGDTHLKRELTDDENFEEVIWLPRQDQLQKMVCEHHTPHVLLDHFV